MQELETALKEEYEQNVFSSAAEEEVDNIAEIARPTMWQKCLGVSELDNKMDMFDIFDLPEQNILREDCQLFVCKCLYARSGTHSTIVYKFISLLLQRS